MGNKNSKRRQQGGDAYDNGAINHFLYIHMNSQEEEMSDITKQVLSFIQPNIPILNNNGINMEVFTIDKFLLKNKDLIKLLKKNGILKLPALKIYDGNQSTLIIGANQILEYYNKYLGLQMSPPQQQKMSQPQRESSRQIAQQRPPPQKRSSLSPIDDDGEEIAIGENKNISSKLDEMVKFREMSKKGYKNNDSSYNNNHNSYGSNHNSKHSDEKNKSRHKDSKSSNKIKYKSNISAEDLKDSPFREGDLDDLDDLDDNISVSSSLLPSLNYLAHSTPKNNSFSNLGDDEEDDEKDALMAKAFWDNSPFD